MMSVKRYLCVTFVLLVFLCICGCPFESEFPLSQCSEANIDKGLLGAWRLEPGKGEPAGTLAIYRFNDHEYVILAKGEDEEDTDVIRAFSTNINGHQFLNIQDINGSRGKKRKWEFINYSASDNKLVLKVVLGDVFKKKRFASSKELFAFIQENIQNEALYGKDTTQTFSRLDE
ncbi:MAG: hypothetical protein JRF49_09915 [Deltaproteobacteria bacterium]|nr:hypothetical protein [Deltaproteobacteria bacterium]